MSKEINDFFSRASPKKRSEVGKFYTESEWNSWEWDKALDGAIKFKNATLGDAGGKVVTKSLDEMADVLNQLGIASSPEEGRRMMESELMNSIFGRELNYGWRDWYLQIDRVTNGKSEIAYRIGDYRREEEPDNN